MDQPSIDPVMLREIMNQFPELIGQIQQKAELLAKQKEKERLSRNTSDIMYPTRKVRRRPSTASRPIRKKCDPVNRYKQTQNEWKKVGGDVTSKRRDNLRLEVRSRMMQARLNATDSPRKSHPALRKRPSTSTKNLR
eukprot:TRINITY_DN31733_c4_g1_i1.p1 TRINITY_DN31733_c4_g1~~TRINITY_DN31733_c4_g1_i1.p1  ORF type:complete len:137 (+),score=28.13 TRINITY_DN31733_c4_g1_i1:129-539(+)